MKIFLYLIALTLVSACSSQYGRYQQKHDSHPSRKPTQAELRDATPRYEPYRKANSRPYTVRGKHYTVLESAKDFSEIGIASWYGKKFHGHLTANGEIYNMYAMSAAHKHLPLPTYLQVTNLANNKSVIVRVNDRGPFHQDRIIDLSYSAAYKLDMLKTGTAKVKITAITNFDKPYINNTQIAQKTIAKKNEPKVSPLKKAAPIALSTSSASDKILANTIIEVFNTPNKLLAEKSAEALAILHQRKSQAIAFEQGYKVTLGPFESQDEINQVLERLQETGYPKAYKKVIFTP